MVNDEDFFLKELKKEFLTNLVDVLDKMESLIKKLSLEEGSGDEKEEATKELWREVHSLKGSAGTYGFQFISNVCHSWEDLMAGHKRENLLGPALSAQYLDYVDLLRDFQEGPEREIEKLEAKLLSLTSSEEKRPKRALVLESSSMMITVYYKELSHLGYQTSFAQDGYLAMGRLLNEKFDLIITSLNVPTINGVDLINTLKIVNGPNQLTKTILVTSSHHKELKILNDNNYVTSKDKIINELRSNY